MEQPLKYYETVFAPLGGQLRRDRADKWWELDRGDFIFEIELAWSHAGLDDDSGLKLAVECAVSHKELSKIAARICGDPDDVPQTFRYDQRFVKVESLSGADLVYRKMIEEEVESILKMDMQMVVKEFAGSCPDQPTMRQIMHLASLAWLADFATLMDYEKIFERGYHMNFAPTINREMIQRAMEIAIERA